MEMPTFSDIATSSSTSSDCRPIEPLNIAPLRTIYPPRLQITTACNLSSEDRNSLSAESIPSDPSRFSPEMAQTEAQPDINPPEENDMHASVSELSSTMTEIELIAEKAAFPWLRRCETRIPEPHERACDPPRGWFSIYQVQVWRGFRYPLPEGICDLLRFWCTCPGQIHPNTWTDIVGHYILCQGFNREFNADFFWRLGSAKLHWNEDHVHFQGRRNKYFYSFACRVQSVKDWKEDFFFIKVQEDAPEFPTRWKSRKFDLPRYKYPRHETHETVLLFELLRPRMWTWRTASNAFINNQQLIHFDRATGKITYLGELYQPKGTFLTLVLFPNFVDKNAAWKFSQQYVR